MRPRVPPAQPAALSGRIPPGSQQGMGGGGRLHCGRGRGRRDARRDDGGRHDALCGRVRGGQSGDGGRGGGAGGCGLGYEGGGI